MIDKPSSRRRRRRNLGQILTDAVNAAFGAAAGQTGGADPEHEDVEDSTGGTGHDGRQTATLP